MNGPGEIKPGVAFSDYLAAERTVLAWIRTGLALMGFGFVVARFGLFLQQLQVIQHAPSAQSYGFSEWFGTALIASGVIVNVYAGWRYSRLVGKLNRGETTHPYPSIQAVAMVYFLALVGLGGLPHNNSKFRTVTPGPRSGGIHDTNPRQRDHHHSQQSFG